jgi:hypothetical protein
MSPALSSTVLKPAAIAVDTQPAIPSAFDSLIESISRVFESHQNDLESINHNSILDLMRNYEGREEEWTPYVEKWEEDKTPYVRNLVQARNKQYNLVTHVESVCSSSDILCSFYLCGNRAWRAESTITPNTAA